MAVFPPTAKTRIYTAAAGLWFRVFGEQGPGLISLDDARKPSADAIAAEAATRAAADTAETNRATAAENALAARPYVKFSKKYAITTGTVVTVTFPAGLFSSAPVVSADIEGDTGYNYNCFVRRGSVTKDGCIVEVYRSPLTLTVVLGLLNFFTAPGNVTVNVMAMDATA